MKYIDKFKDKKSGEVRQIRDTTIVANSGAAANGELKSLTIGDETYSVDFFNESAINQSLVPEANQTKNLGSKTKNWKSVFGKEVHASKFRLDTGKVDETTGEPVYETFAVHQSDELKIQRGGSSVAQFGDGSFTISDGNHKIIEKHHDGDLKLNYYTGTNAVDINESEGIRFFDSNGDSVMKLSINNNFTVFEAGAKYNSGVEAKIIDTSDAHGGINIGADNFDMVHQSQINLIPNFEWKELKNGKYVTQGVNHVDPGSYDRIKIGGYEYVTPEGLDSGNCPEVILAYKNVGSENDVVPFAITKDGHAYYNGGELATKKDLSAAGGGLYMHNYDIEGSFENQYFKFFFNFISTHAETLTLKEISDMFGGDDACKSCGGYYIDADGSSRSLWGVKWMIHKDDVLETEICWGNGDSTAIINIKQDDITAHIVKVI